MARPPFKPTTAMRRKVAAAAGGGMAHDEIATGLGISRNTLEKYFTGELHQGACQKRLEVLDAMARTALKGNVAAQKAYLATAAPRGIAPPADSGKASKPVGKKEQAVADAKDAQAGTDWSDLLPTPGRVQ